MLPEAARAMALIRKSGRKRNFRKRHVCVRQQLHGAFDPPPYQIVMRGNSDRLLERAHEVADREIRQFRQSFNADPLVDIAVDVLA